MKLVLLQDVKNVGKKGELVDVADGYARNFILPRKLGVPATEGTMRSRDKEAADQKARKLREKEQAQELATSLEATPVQLTVRVGNNGKLFGSITSADIAVAIKEQLRYSVEKKNIQLKDPLKALGEHTIAVKLHPEVQAKLRLLLAASPE